MRSFALLTLTVALGSAACNDQQSVMATDTDTTTSDVTGEDTTTSTTTTTTTTTTGEPSPTTGTTTGLTPPTTGTTTTTTGDETTTTTTTTGEPDTTGTTEPVQPDAAPYESCSNEMDIGCQGNAVCVDTDSTNGQVSGSYCAPKCSGGPMNCSKPQGAGAGIQAVCAFDTDLDMKADICALICNLADDQCGNSSACEDVGIPEMMVMGVVMKFGICTHA